MTWAPLVGIGGSLLMGTTTLLTALVYTGTKGEKFSPLNHWVSELGQVGVSQLALLFNVGLIIGGVLFAIFMVGLGRARRSSLARLYLPLGVATGVAGMFVGVFPMNTALHLHGIAALSFFTLGWITVGLGSLDFWRAGDARFPRWLAWIGVFTVASSLGFLIVLLPLLGGEGFAAPSVRPDVWIVPILEWAAVIGLLGWTLATSVTWLRARDSTS
jgi:hypothetical membrane protein